MKEINTQKVAFLVDQYETLKRPFRWENSLSKWLVALAHTMQNKAVDIEHIRDVKGYMKQETGMFSPFRGTMMFPIAGLLCVNAEQPEQAFDRMIRNYSTLKAAGLRQSTYLPTALYTMAMVYEGTDFEGYASQAADVYREMKQNHPFLTGGDDYALAVLLASERGRLNRIEACYQALKANRFTTSNSLQMMSHILTFSDEPAEQLAKRCADISVQLKENGLRVYATYYPAIALIALLGDDQIVEEVIRVAWDLKHSKHSKWLQKGMNVMMAAAIVSSSYVEAEEEGVVTATLQVSVQAIIAAQQAAMIAAVSASAAASAASS